ncbi:MAG: hypothetical protein IT434_01915 [Phycisphaerales bacterium]|nr:hypothetical protein [Phycisphaerales bacterium]
MNRPTLRASMAVGFAVGLGVQPASAAFIRDAHWTSGNAALWGQHSYNDSVVQLTVTTNLGNVHFLSGVYGGGAVITSGHGLNYGNGEFAASITVRAGSNAVASPWETVTSSSFLIHPGYNPAAGAGHSIDLGLVFCNLSTVSPALWSTTSPVVGTEVEQCGFGLIYTYTGGLRQPSDNSLKLAGRNTLRNPDALYPGYLISRWDQVTGFTEEWGSAPGDSGGAWWENRSGTRYLVGLNTFSTGQNPGDISGALDIAPYSSWIATNIPAPNAAWLTLLGVCAAGSRRRRTVLAGQNR